MLRLSQKSRTMMDAIGGIRALLKWESTRPDNFVFRLHYKVSFGCLLVCSFIVSAKQYVGEPIVCITTPALERLIDQYCWIHSTFTVMRPDKYGRLTYFAGSDEDNSNNEKIEGFPRPARRGDSYPGVQGLSGKDRKLYHRYYQWVCFVLLFQALSFYIPRYIWKVWDAGRLKLLISGLQVHSFNSSHQVTRKDQIVDYFMSHRGSWGISYAFKFYFCEILNLVNVGAQLYLMDKFLGHSLSSFGFDLLTVTDEDPYRRTDPLAVIFPKVTKCTFNAHGIGGSIVSHDAICVLSINNINEKIYIFLWFWFVVLVGITVLGLVYRLLTFTSWRIRYNLLSLNYGSSSTSPHLRNIVHTVGSSDWFVLYQISKNINTNLFVGLVKDLDEKLNTQKESKTSGQGDNPTIIGGTAV